MGAAGNLVPYLGAGGGGERGELGAVPEGGGGGGGR